MFKHTALTLLLRRLLQKPKPFMVIDTHAGGGLYDLSAPEALKTGEAIDGVGRLELGHLAAAAPYATAVGPHLARGYYPGSPVITSDALRLTDRLAACELRPDDAGQLKRLFASDKRVSVHHRDGYEAMLALVPPTERRGLVFVDPPFERTDEAERLAGRLAAATRKWPTGIFAAWYPIKDFRIASVISDTLAREAMPNVLRVDFLREPVDGRSLVGGGMVFINAPWGFVDELGAAAAELLLGMGCVRGHYEFALDRAATIRSMVALAVEPLFPRHPVDGDH
ncbi:23S rRNA (adenine(2030)-N(6))-methyltransferase RlmJ [Methylobacterium komagatae]